MLRKKKNGVQWLEFELLADIPKLRHGVFLRHGGESKKPYDSLNVSYYCGDIEKDVDKNRQKISEILGTEKLINCNQCHGKTIKQVLDDKQTVYESCDALTTSVPNIALMITHADCQAAIFYDPMHHAVANVHCGWRGNVQNIYAETVTFMKKCYGSQPKDLLVVISPSLGPNNAEFVNYQTELPESFWDFQVKPTFFNLWEIGKQQLLDAGILSHHIQIAELCTFDGKDDYFSFRREKVTGRHGTVVILL